jgi:hypothetical protein
VIATAISPTRAAKTPFPIWAVRIRPSQDVCVEPDLVNRKRTLVALTAPRCVHHPRDGGC